MDLVPPAIVEAALADRSAMSEPLCAYYYDLDALAAHARAIRDAMPHGCSLFYAIKANAEPPLLQCLAPIVDGFEAASGGEIAWLRDHVPEAPVVFGGPAKLDDELALAVEAGVELIHVESLHELRRLGELVRRAGRKTPILLRVNVGLDGARSRLMMGGAPSPFGVDEAALDDCVAFLAENPLLDLRGFHIHSLSHQLDRQAHIRIIRTYFDRFHRWRDRWGLRVDHLNMGGGIGIDYREPQRQFDWPAFMGDLEQAIAEYRMQAISLRFELGRFLTGFCGVYATEIVDLKQSGGRWFALCRGGTHHFRTPAAQGHDHPLLVLPRNAGPGPEVEQAEITFVGQLCTPKDVLASNVPTACASIGDLVLFPLAGAYGWTISHQNFLRHPPPRFRFLGADRAASC